VQHQRPGDRRHGRRQDQQDREQADGARGRPVAAGGRRRLRDAHHQQREDQRDERHLQSA
jgi:hypothetical protein